MRPLERAALRALAQRESWRVNALPAEVGVDELRILDADGLIQARAWILHNMTTDPARPVPLKPGPWPMGWVSPGSNRDLMGSWSEIVRDAAAKPDTAAEVRVTDKGHATLAQQRDKPDPSAASVPDDGGLLRREVDRYLRQRLQWPELAAAASRLAHAVSDEAWWAKQVEEYRRTARRYSKMGWTRQQKRAELRFSRPDRVGAFRDETAQVRPYWRFSGHAALPVLDVESAPPPPRSAAEAWDLVLLFWVMTTEDAPLRGIRLDTIADWDIGHGWGRRGFWRDVLDTLGERGVRAAEAEALIIGRARESLALLRDRETSASAAAPTIEAKQAQPPAQDLVALVTLDQAAAAVQQSKRTLERYCQEGKLPEPDIRGGGGRPHKWKWATLLPALRQHFRADLPDRFPGSRIV